MRKLTKHESPAARADELFREQQREIYIKTDKLFARLMFWQWIGCIAMAVIISPYTWSGQTSAIHIHVWASIFLGGSISLFPIWLTRAWPGAMITRYVIAIAQMLMSALLISVTGGRIETHFHVFGSLVILSFYRDWRVLVPATIVVGLDHFIRGVYWPYSVYGVLAASPWRSMEHAAWVVFEDVFLVISCFRSINEMRSIANRTAALELSEQNFRQIFQEAPIGMAVVGLDEKFLQANARLCQMVDYSENELRDRTPLDITHPDDVAFSREIAKSMLKGPVHNRVEKRYVRKDGGIVWAARTGCVISDQAGKPRHFLIMVEDISKRKKAEEAVRDSEERYRLLFETNPYPVWVYDPETLSFLAVNQAAIDRYGFSREEFLSMKIKDIRPAEDVDALLDDVSQFSPETSGWRHRKKNGAVIDVEITARPISFNGKQARLVLVNDVTARLRGERALEQAKDEADRANKAKSEFLSRMSHELRTPLNAILGFGQLLERQSPTPTQRNRIRHVINAGRHLLGLINEVLDISRIEVGRMQFSLEPVCVLETIEETLDLMRPLAHERSIKLRADVDLDGSVHVLADRQRFKQVLLNLLTNAVKYTPVYGSVIVSCIENGNENLRIRVADTGPGIAKEKLARLFTPFDRLGAEQSDVEGTGLGLALSQRLMHAMGGLIGVENSCDRGSIFWVELPRTKSPIEQTPPPKMKISAHSRSEGRHKCTVLYIEDNLSNLTLVEQLLEERPEIELLSAMQGRVGLDLARQHSPGLILLDLHLPDLPGWEVLSQLKADSSTAEIPVVVISADATAPQVKRLLKLGAVRYLTKPLDVVEFFRVLDQTAASTNGATKSISLPELTEVPSLT
ncbi:MAG TPA: PAS domain S-box protein [Chthoniobacterales bacterium]|nr:PAS domain S-box protein [Chthoniobacterales bacterium]